MFLNCVLSKYAYLNTKRGILSLLCSLCNPLGIVVSVLLEPKLIVQEIRCQNIDWDENILKNLESRINTWKSQLHLLETITTPRFHHFQNSSEIEGQIFNDVSSLGDGTVDYYRTVSNFDIKVSFIIAKSRLTPLKEKSFTTPKLELQAA